MLPNLNSHPSSLQDFGCTAAAKGVVVVVVVVVVEFIALFMTAAVASGPKTSPSSVVPIVGTLLFTDEDTVVGKS